MKYFSEGSSGSCWHLKDGLQSNQSPAQNQNGIILVFLRIAIICKCYHDNDEVFYVGFLKMQSNTHNITDLISYVILCLMSNIIFFTF